MRRARRRRRTLEEECVEEEEKDAFEPELEEPKEWSKLASEKG
jgi:hypothetical protein